MKGKLCVITGATSGIGFVAAERLGSMGARLLLVGRDRAKGARALASLKAKIPGLQADIRYADLSKLSEMRRLGAEIAAAEPRIDVLINNAGAMFRRREVTEDGLERTFALNHMGYFVLTQALIPSLAAAAAPARIVNVASSAHRGQTLDFTDLQGERDYRSFRTYGRSKLCNILFTRALARRLGPTGISANCLHPGFVATNFGNNNSALFRLGLNIAKLFAVSPEKGAETIVYLASSPEVAGASGGYYYQCRPATPSDAARDDGAARRLWEESAALAARGLP